MRRCVVVLALLLAFAVACPPPATVWASSEGGHGGGEKKEAKKESKKGDKEGAKIENGVLNYGPVVVNILSNKGYRILKLSMQIQCEDNGSAERLTKPDVKQAVLLLLSTRVGEELLANTGKMILRKDLLATLSEYAGQGKVKNLYFTEFVLQ